MHTHAFVVRRAVAVVFAAGALLASVLMAVTAYAAVTGSLMPTADGTYAAWTPSSGATHYTLVDETTCNGTTDYVSTAVAGNRDSYSVSLASVPNGSTITAISITPCASRNSGGGGGSATLNVFYRFNGSNSADSGAYALTGTTPANLAATNFSSLSFVKSSTSTLEAGVVYTSGTKGARVSRLATVITYTPPAPTVTTNAATSLGTSTATLNGSANPNGASATGWFRYSTTNPGSCTDSFGTRAPSSGGSALGSGTSSVNYSQGATGLTPNTTYYFCALASNSGGTSTGSILSFTTNDVAPAAPSSLFATTISTSQIDLSWTDNSSNELGFKLERSTAGASGPWTQIATTTSANYSNTGLTSGTPYWYRVRAYNAAGNSSYSNTAVATTTALTIPSAPTTLSATNVNGTENALSWTDNSGNEDGFKVERSGSSAFGPWTNIATTSANATTYNDTGVSADLTYWYRVRAYNAAGNSAYTNTDYVITATVVPNAPATLTNFASTSSVSLSWSDSSTNEESFNVERSTDGTNWSVLDTVAMGGTFYSDTAVSSGNTYYYRVNGVNAVGNGAYSTTTVASL